MSYGVNLHQARAGKQSIGALATQKVQSDALNLGFPSAYQSVYAAKHIPERYFPTADRPPMTMWAGNDLQAQYHEQKRVDADFMAGAKVKSTQISRVRFVGTPHGLGHQPKPVLGQRKFANPSQGAFILNSTRQDSDAAPFHYAGGGDYTSEFKGGVLRSAEGQAYGKRVLLERVGQLNAIATAKQDFTSGMPSSSGVSTQSVPAAAASAVNPAIELNLLLQSIIDALVGSAGDAGKLDKFELTTATRALGLIFRMAPESDDGEFNEDLMGKIDTILQLLNGSLDDEQASAGMTASTRETALSLQVLFTKLREYLERMIAGRTLSKPERIALSKNLVSSLGFSKMLKYSGDANDSGLLREADRDRLFSSQQAQRFIVGDMDSDGYDSDGNDSDFDESGRPREDEAHDGETGVERGDRSFDEDERSRFGMNSGMYFNSQGRGAEAFLGEEAPSSASQSARSARFAPAASADTGAPDVRGVFDPDTQGFNISSAAVRRPPPPSMASSLSRDTRQTGRDAAAAAVASSSAPTRSTATRSIGPTGKKHYNKLPSRFNAEYPAEGAQVRYALGPTGAVRKMMKMPVAPEASIIPTKQSQLPTTRAGYIELSRKLIEAGGPTIVVYEGSSVQNIRKNFVKRLGLVGKY